MLSHWNLRYTSVLAILLLGAILRLTGIREAGVTYADDLRVYSGIAVKRALTRPATTWIRRLEEAYRLSVSYGARPALVWMVFIPATLGVSSLGNFYILFALFGILSIWLVQILCERWFDQDAAFYAALWLAVSAAHVEYSRSGLPPSPAMALMLLGLVFLSATRNSTDAFSRLRLLTVGCCFALAVAFHPAYLLYLFVPGLIYAWMLRTQLGAKDRFTAELIRGEIFLLAPTPVMVLLYDLPSVAGHLVHGNLSRSAFGYLASLKNLSESPTVTSNGQEGFRFWPQYLLTVHGLAGFIVILAALAAILASRRKIQRSVWYVLIWIICPWALFAAWPNLNSYARLYAPILPGIACLVGLGISQIARTLHRFHPLRSGVGHIALTLLILSVGISETAAMISMPGRERDLGEYLKRNSITSVVGFLRTDDHALSDVQVTKVFNPAEIESALCRNMTDLFVLSPAPFYLILRHQEYLFDGLGLKPIFIYSNPYMVPARMFDGYSTEERLLAQARPEFKSLGLYRVTNKPDCPTQ